MNEVTTMKNPISIFRVLGSVLCDSATMPFRLMKFDSKRIHGLWKNKPRNYALKSAGIIASDFWLTATFLLGVVATNKVPNLYEHYIAAGILIVGSTYFSTWSISDSRQRKHGFDLCPRFMRLFDQPKSGYVPGRDGPA